jgi:hypothetical protein
MTAGVGNNGAEMEGELAFRRRRAGSKELPLLSVKVALKAGGFW